MEVDIAHIRESDGAEQSVAEHCLETAVPARGFGGDAGLGEAAEVVALLHDTGKHAVASQHYLRSAAGQLRPGDAAYVDAAALRGKIDHAGAGAAYILSLLEKRTDAVSVFARQALALVIASHHSGLADCLDLQGRDILAERVQKNNAFAEPISRMDEAIREKVRLLVENPAFFEKLTAVLMPLHVNRPTKRQRLQLGLLTKFLLSCLLDADRLNTAEFANPGQAQLRGSVSHTTMSTLLGRLKLQMARFDERTKGLPADSAEFGVCRIRQEVADLCLRAAERPKGLFVLTVPTGGGKSATSLYFCLRHAEKWDMRRVIYILPYTFVIDQNAQDARDWLEPPEERGQVVLEHHSNLTPDEDTELNRLLAENWDSKVVFSTMVQFLDAFYGGGTANARRLHNMANAVLVFDEVQSVPVQCVHLFNQAVRCLTEHLGSTVVFCTATQPLLDQVTPEKRAVRIPPENRIIPDEAGLYRRMRRCTVQNRVRGEGYSPEVLAALVLDELPRSGSVLVIVNTKDMAFRLHQVLVGVADAELFYLTTNLCPAHRVERIRQIRERLSASPQRPIVCVSTSMIEAGVNLDFGCVIRSLAGMDSIAQAAGRCNRHGRRPTGRVLIVNPVDESVSRLPDIQIGARETERVLREFAQNPDAFDGDLLSPKSMERFYQYYFFARAGEMGYRVRLDGVDTELYELLSDNTPGVQAYMRAHHGCEPPFILRQAFQTAEEAFAPIDEDTRGVVVCYGEGKDIIDELRTEHDPDRLRALLRRAQRFSVNLRRGEYERFWKAGRIHPVRDGVPVEYLDAECYDETYGIRMEK